MIEDRQKPKKMICSCATACNINTVVNSSIKLLDDHLSLGLGTEYLFWERLARYGIVGPSGGFGLAIDYNYYSLL